MKILFVANRGEIGGAHTALENTVTKLCGEGYDITILTPNKNSKWFEFSNNIGCKCVFVKYYEVGYAFNITLIRRIIKFALLPILYLFNKLNFFKAVKLDKILDIKSFDYIQTNTNRDDFGIVLSNMYHVKHIMYLREFDTEFFKLKYLHKNIYKYYNENTLYFISVSDVVKKGYVKKGLDEKKIYTIYDGIENGNIVRKTSFLRGETFNILMVSNICEEKGQRRVIEAVKNIGSNLKIKLDLYGTGSVEYVNSLKNYIDKNNLNDKINFMGYDSKIKSKICNYDLAIMCSKIDGFGLVTVEYMMAEVPVLVSNTGANFEILTDKVSGYMFDYNEDKSLENKILYIANNYAQATSVAHTGYAHALEKFSLESSYEELRKLYERGVKIDGQKNK